jgi:hypothetical protein
MAYEYLDKYSVEELQGYFSDFHKDFYGSRPRFATPEQWRSREWLVTSIDGIHTAMDRMKETFAGREELRASGWEVLDYEVEDSLYRDQLLLEQAERLANEDCECYGLAQ